MNEREIWQFMDCLESWDYRQESRASCKKMTSKLIKLANPNQRACQRCRGVFFAKESGSGHLICENCHVIVQVNRSAKA